MDKFARRYRLLMPMLDAARKAHPSSILAENHKFLKTIEQKKDRKNAYERR
jgi:hypothetical protein